MEQLSDATSFEAASLCVKTICGLEGILQPSLHRSCYTTYFFCCKVNVKKKPCVVCNRP